MVGWAGALRYLFHLVTPFPKVPQDEFKVEKDGDELFVVNKPPDPDEEELTGFDWVKLYYSKFLRL